MIPRVLVVDDDDGIRRAIATALGRSGFDVRPRATALPRCGCARCDARHRRRRLQHADRWSRGRAHAQAAVTATAIFVAVLTGDDDPAIRERCRAAGADAVLIKPISPSELRRVLTAAALALEAAPAA